VSVDVTQTLDAATSGTPVDSPWLPPTVDDATPGPQLGSHRQAGTRVRRLLDVAIALGTLVVLSPVVLACAIAVKLDSKGPVLFKQRRVGRDRKEFTVLKLRTMTTGADTKVHQDYIAKLISRDETAPVDVADDEDATDGLYKLAGDARVTRVGEKLRAWSLDEVPQLWNVVRGEMAIVGPRPVIAYEVEMYPEWYHERFAVKPGLTGLWQVSGRNERTYEEMVRFDVEYARSSSLRADINIMWRTIRVVLLRKGVA
jgi:lipopolysaccharide/colanic/teichoic acid biosynthesis glycosyltransferase